MLIALLRLGLTDVISQMIVSLGESFVLSFIFDYIKTHRHFVGGDSTVQWLRVWILQPGCCVSVTFSKLPKLCVWPLPHLYSEYGL